MFGAFGRLPNQNLPDGAPYYGVSLPIVASSSGTDLLCRLPSVGQTTHRYASPKHDARTLTSSLNVVDAMGGRPSGHDRLSLSVRGFQFGFLTKFRLLSLQPVGCPFAFFLPSLKRRLHSWEAQWTGHQNTFMQEITRLN